MRKIFIIVLASLFLSGCVQVVAFVPSVITGVTSGSAVQAGLSYGFSYGVKERTGKTPLEHVLALSETAKKPSITISEEDLISSFAPR